MKKNSLSPSQSEFVWQKLSSDFSFDPSIDNGNKISITTDKQIHTINIESFWGDAYDHKIPQFLLQAINSFISVTPIGEKIYVLSGEHSSYLLDPVELTVKEMVNSQAGEHPISFIPEENYQVFVTPDFENIWIGNSSERIVTLIGTNLINAFTGIE